MKKLYELVVTDRMTNLQAQRSFSRPWESLEELYFDYEEEYPPEEYEIRIEFVG